MSLSSMYGKSASIDEAIEHCLEVAARNEIEAKSMGYHFVGSQKAEAQNIRFECAADHRQLAEWLTEYKALREENINLKTEELIGIFGTLCDYMVDNGRCDVFCPYAKTKDKDDECEAWRTIQKIRQEK